MEQVAYTHGELVVLRWLEGDDAAFEQLICIYGNQLEKACRRMSNDLDMVDDAFIEAVEKVRRLKMRSRSKHHEKQCSRKQTSEAHNILDWFRRYFLRAYWNQYVNIAKSRPRDCQLNEDLTEKSMLEQHVDTALFAESFIESVGLKFPNDLWLPELLRAFAAGYTVTEATKDLSEKFAVNEEAMRMRWYRIQKRLKAMFISEGYSVAYCL